MPPSVQRVVVTGIGLVTPLGCGVAENWDGLITGRSGIAPITRFDASGFPVRFAGEVRGFVAEKYVERKDVKKLDPFILYALAAAQMAVDDARLAAPGEAADRMGVILGVGVGGLGSIEEGRDTQLQWGWKRLSPFMIPRIVPNLAPAQVAMRFGYRGVNFAIASACASGGHAVGEAFRSIRSGYHDVMLSGGTEAAVTPLGIGGFSAMRAMSSRNEEPERASRPFDKDRDGFVLAEGAGVLVLESAARATARGAPIYAEVIGYGANADAYHITAPSPEGKGAAKCMQLALADADITPAAVGYINAHGTSTPYNDVNETQAIKHVFAEHAFQLAVSSTKSMTGHSLGAAGGIEAAYTALALHHGVLPPTINYETPDPECDLDYVPNRARCVPVTVGLTNAFGFGGTNSCLVLKRWDDRA
jgi:3-oxoacyl-[acyl-carrier-protein] synthase II